MVAAAAVGALELLRHLPFLPLPLPMPLRTAALECSRRAKPHLHVPNDSAAAAVAAATAALIKDAQAEAQTEAQAETQAERKAEARWGLGRARGPSRSRMT